MPRDGNGVATKPAGTTATPNQLIESSKFNSVIDDIYALLNAALPITAGGTSAVSKQGAVSALFDGTTIVDDDNFKLAANGDQTKLLSFDLSGLTTAATETVVAKPKGLLSGAGISAPVNLALAASVGSSALTIALKGADGNDPSATNPVYIPFRNVTAATGTPSVLTVTAATSLVMSSGSTMGFASGVIGRLWIVGFNDGGTFRLGAVNCLSGTSIMALRDGIYSSTAEGGAGAADSAQVIYTGSAVTDKAMTILGYLEATEATAGTWATAPSAIQLMEPGIAKPGEVVQICRTETSAVASGTTVMPLDDTIPQSGEGVQFFSQTVVPKFAANMLCVEPHALLSSTGGTATITGALFRDSTADAFAARSSYVETATGLTTISMQKMVLAGSVASTAFKFRAGGNGPGTFTLNGSTGAQRFGGVANSSIEVREIMA